MNTAERASPRVPPWGLAALGSTVAVVGWVLLIIGLKTANALDFALAAWGPAALGWGSVITTLNGLGVLVRASTPPALSGPALQWLAAGSVTFVAGLVLLGNGLRRPPMLDRPPSAAVGRALYAPLREWRDLHWSTLFAYCAAVLGSEVIVVLLLTVLAGGHGPRHVQLSPLTALGVGLAVGCFVAFACGFLGAARSGRLSVPEATLAFFYFGLPFPGFLNFVMNNPLSAPHWAARLREVTYVANLLGRPTLAIALIVVTLLVALVLGMTSGFVATGSGKLDLRLSFELFVARRHVGIFRPSLVLGAFAVLLLGIVCPLLVFFILRSAEDAVERTRIRELGIKDPLHASVALNDWKARAQSPTAMMTALSVGGVGTSVMAMIIVMSVMSGFETDLKQKILGNSAHAVVLKYGDPFDDYLHVVKQVHEVPGVVGTSPFTLNEAMIASGENISGVMLKGIDSTSVGQVSDLPKDVEEGGQVSWLDHPEQIVARHIREDTGPLLHEKMPSPQKAPERTPPLPDDSDPLIERSAGDAMQTLPGIIIGRELGHALRAGVGDRINLVSPMGGELGPHGPTPKSRPFRVAGIFYSGMFDYDSKFAYISLKEAQSFFNIRGVSGLELKVADVDDARRVSDNVIDELDGYPYHAKDWGEMNHNLFSALRTEKLAMAILLTVMVIVATGLIVATVIMLVLEKRKEISVLKALGVPDAGIVKIFLAEGLQIGVLGGVLGLLSGLVWCLIIAKFGIEMDPEVYYIPSLPVRVEPLQTAMAVIVAILITYLASIYPALKAAEVEPVEGLKSE